MPPTPRDSTVGYRRNGKKQACEPCRKGKLACDHGAPFCGRCTRRETTARCIYHPSPMTKKAGAEVRPLPSPQETPPSVSSKQSGQLFSPQSVAAAQPPFFAGPFNGRHDVSREEAVPDSGIGRPCPEKVLSPVGQPKPGWKNAVFPRSARYYGSTSYSAIFSEHQVKLDEKLLDIGEETRRHPGAWTAGQPLLGRNRPTSPTVRQEQTIKALWNIPSKEICAILLKPANDFIIRSVTMEPTLMQHFNNMLWSTFEAELAYPRTNERLTVISDALFTNEERPLPPGPDDGVAWANTFSGRNIRFEMLGLFFCYIGLAYQSLQDWDPLFSVIENQGRDRRQTAWRMNECAEVCLKMCDLAETVNYLVPCLIINLKRLQTGCTGDDTYSMRRLHGDMVTTAITSGLHRLPPYGTSKITVASEFRRRLFSSIYCNDKTHASLYGTPPLLTRRFCDVEACLDLPDTIVFHSEDKLAQEINDLDSNGWNKSTTHYGLTTLLRGKVKLSVIREEILELALGVNVDFSRSRINDLHQRCEQIYEALPEILHYHSEEKIPKNSTGGLLYDQANIRLLYLQNKFLIDRVAIARGLANGQSLLDTAFEIMDTSLMFWIKRDQLLAYAFNFDWIITYFSIPAAGAICVELLKKTTCHGSTDFSRTDAIQKLSLFIAFLQWVRPTDGNHALAQRLRVVVQRVLNHILEAPQKAAAYKQENEQINFDPMLTGFDNMGTDDLDWLNTIDWTQGSWMDFN